jgi:hypothetical protein
MKYSEFEAIPAEYLRCLSTRARNCIINELGHEASIGDIIAMSDRDLLRVPNFGKKSLRELRSAIDEMASRHGIQLVNFEVMQRRLSSVLVDGLELVGERRMVEELLRAIKHAKESARIRGQIRCAIESITPSEVPFFSVREAADLNDKQWRAK